MASMSGCEKDDDSKQKIIMNSPDMTPDILPESITATSISIYWNSFFDAFMYISENEKEIDEVEAEIARIGHISYGFTTCRNGSLDSRETNTFRNLKPDTEYFVIVYGELPDGKAYRVEASPKISFKTPAFELKVDMGGSVNWCGVNFLEDRDIADYSQYLETSSYYFSELPDPQIGSIPGDWRLPTKDELYELCENCTVTFVDFSEKYVRLTSQNGSNLYIPFTYHRETDWNYKEYDDKRLMLFPSDNERYGLYIDAPLVGPLSKLDPRVKFGKKLDYYKICVTEGIKNDDKFYYWSYLDATVTPNVMRSATEKRGCRFVCDK